MQNPARLKTSKSNSNKENHELTCRKFSRSKREYKYKIKRHQPGGIESRIRVAITLNFAKNFQPRRLFPTEMHPLIPIISGH